MIRNKEYAILFKFIISLFPNISPTRIIATTEKPIATINVIDERFNAIWFEACSFFPNNPDIHIAAIKKRTSKKSHRCKNRTSYCYENEKTNFKRKKLK